MSKTFRGKLAMGTEERIRLSTNTGLTGYKIKDFNIISVTPGSSNSEFIGQVYVQSTTPSATVDFSSPNLLAVAFRKSVGNDGLGADSEVIIFDSKKFNQDIFISIMDATGNTVECNYYIELEPIKLDLNEATVATLKDMRGRE